MTPCPDENVIVQMLHGRLAPGAARAVEEHVDRCSACAALLSGLAQMAAVASAGGAPPGVSGGWPQGPPSTGYRARPPLAGQSIGRYVIERPLGDGAMGVVYAGVDPVLGRRVAIKVIRPELAGMGGGEEPRARLLREARAMAALAHPHVVPVHDAGIVGDEVFLAMELVQGVTLAEWLRQGPRDPRDVLAVFRDAALGLAAAHEAGVVHRDFKPANVLVGPDGRAKVTDFGLARADRPAVLAPGVGPFEVVRTAPGALVGTPAYMAPEQLFLRPVDARADQFAFSVALYEALYARAPFGGATIAERRWEVAYRRAPSPPDHRGVPRGIADVVRRGLEPRPEDRHPSMHAMLDALDAAARRTEETHLAINAACQGAAAVLHVLFVAAWGIALVSASPSPSPGAADGSTASSEQGIFVSAFATYLVVCALLLVWWAPLGVLWAPLNALGLLRRWRWARRSTMIYALFAAVTCWGAPYAIYVIWSLRRPGVKALFEKR
jgi:serine/threonine-protein kinase